MWTCRKCGEQLEDAFGECWKCGTFQDGTENPGFTAEPGDPSGLNEPSTPSESSEPLEPGLAREKGPIHCVRCDQPLTFMGTKAFHEGNRWGALGDIGELFVNKENFDVYSCPRCGRVEFFVSPSPSG